MYPRTKPPIGFEERENTVYHVGVSGGKDSSAVLAWMVRCSQIDPKKIKASFCDIGNDHEWTIEHVKLLNDTVHPIETIRPELDFFELVFKKRRFPSTKARFCTDHLKIQPTQKHITSLMKQGYHVIAVSGVRRDESEARSTLEQFDYSSGLLVPQWRPLIHWDLDDVMGFHAEQKIPLNPLYSMGAQRVGCWPCIMSRKAEIRNIALNFPERITEIREAEKKFETLYGRYSSFFPRTMVPDRFRKTPYIVRGEHIMEDILEVIGTDEAGEDITRKIGEKPMMIASIDDVVEWSLTGKNAKGSWEDEPQQESGCMSGFCE